MKNLALCLLVLALSSCFKKKSNTLTIDYTSMYNCHNQNTWNTAKTFNALLGSWQMNKAYGGWTGEMQPENVKLTFSNDNILKVYKEGMLISNAHFSLTVIDSTYFSVVPDSLTQYTPGKIVLCGNEVLFNSSYVDGNDYYYIKVSK